MQKYVSVRDGTPQARLKLLGYYVQRTVTSRTLRRAGTLAAVAGLRALHGPARSTAAADPAPLGTLRGHGWVPLGQRLSTQACAEVLEWLRDRPMVSVRGGGESFALDAVPPRTRIGDYPLETVVNCPHLLDLANHPDLLRLAGAYLGYTPTITLMGLRWSFPADATDADVQGFHRDSEPGSIKLMVYLTDVDGGTGPHTYVPGTHRDRMPLRLHRYADADIARSHGGGVTVTGPAGTAFVIDSKGIHKGTPPVRGARLLLVVQYSLLPCLMYEYAPVAYRGHGVFDAYVNRLMMVAGPAGRRSRLGTADEMPAPSLQD